MLLSQLKGLFTNPAETWQAVSDRAPSVRELLIGLIIPLALIAPICSFIGSTMVGWQVGGAGLEKLTVGTAIPMSVGFFFGIVIVTMLIGYMIYWMAETYDAKRPLESCVAVAAFVGAPMMLSGLSLLYPLLWLNLLIGLAALAYSVYLLYSGLPVVMKIPRERGFVFSSAVLAVGLVFLVGLMVATALLWGFGFGPRYQA